MNQPVHLAIAGYVLSLPALILVSTSFLGREEGLPAALVHPVLVMGGLLLACALNAWSVLRMGLRQDGGDLVGTIAVRVRGGAMNLTAIAISGLLVAVIVAYVLVENFQPRPY